MPPVMRKRGCPNGHEVTVIGLPTKRQKSKQARIEQKERVIPFIKLHSSVKERGKLLLTLLSLWLYTEEIEPLYKGV